jgi:pimeloyl-ACP methyl ester carboxylesterase
VRLNVRTWGEGPRTALLLHGFSDDAETWWQVAPAISDLGFTVIAPDLRGHGLSPRGAGYALAEFAADVVETAPAGLDLALGHSLGALVLGLAAPRLQPRRAVFVDPPWLRSGADLALVRDLPTTADELPVHWSAADVAVDLTSNGRLDPAVAHALAAELLPMRAVPIPPVAVPGSVVLVPELEPALPLDAQPAALAAGYEVRTQPGVSHVMHRDDLDGFLELLRPLLAAEGAAA